MFTARFNNHNYKLGLTLHPGKALAGISHPLEGREVSLLPLTQALLGFLSNKRLLWIFCSVSLPQCTASIPFSPAMRSLCQQQTQSHRDVKSGIVGLRRGSTRETRKRKFRFKERRMLLFAPLSPRVLRSEAGSRIQSDPTPAAKAAAPSPPSWVGVNGPGRWVWRPGPKGRWHLWPLYLLLRTKTENCALRDQWDHSRKMGTEQKGGKDSRGWECVSRETLLLVPHLKFPACPKHTQQTPCPG